MSFGTTEHERAAASYVRSLAPGRQLSNQDVGRLFLGIGAAIGMSREAMTMKIGEAQMAFDEEQRKANSAQMGLLPAS